MITIDNQRIKLIDQLSESLKTATRVDFSLNSATLWAMYELLPHLKAVPEIRLLLDKKPDEVPTLAYDAADWHFYNQLSTKGAAYELVTALETKLIARVGNSAVGSFIFVHQPEKVVGYILNGAPLNTITLGLSPDTKLAMILETPEAKSIAYTIDSLWPHAQDVTADLLAQYRKSAKHYSPLQLYHQAIANIFKEGNLRRDQEDEIKRLKLDQTAIWKMLYSFQRDAVLGGIDKIEKHNGCIIADSVGLGKTFEALAIIKYYQLKNKDILVLSPKKLKENWSLYVENDHRNPFNQRSERFDYKILSHSDLNRKGGIVGNINLDTFNWGNVDLLVIDESHNFRNIPSQKNDENTRYRSLIDKVIKAGLKTKVLMLSATPVNTKLTDLKAQLQIMFEQDDAALKRYNIKSISNLLGETQRKFNHWLKQNQDQIGPYVGAELTDVLPGAYFKLLDLVTIARSRKHIETYYNTSDIGKFPQRLTPISEKADIDTKSEVLANLGTVYETLGSLNLAMYQPLNYVLEHKVAEYNEKYRSKLASGGSFYQGDRDQSLVYLMRINFLKRLESSWFSFSTTLEAILNQIDISLEQINATNENPDPDLDYTFDESADQDDTQLEELMVGGRTQVKIKDIDSRKFLDDLLTDRSRLQRLKNDLANLTPDRDAKLQKLKQIIEDKLNNPINPENKKIIIFSAFADTVDYLYEQLATWLLEKYNIYTASVNGSRNRTNFEHVRNNTYLHEILTHFSPISKNRAAEGKDITDEISLLIATDCISEGQNLQDCDFQINYDIHWNPVRIIQRFGRIDRLGSKNEKIQLINFYPKMDLDSYIDLINRVTGRMMLSDVSSTGQDNVLATQPQGGGSAADAKQKLEANYRTAALKRLQTEVPNLEDLGSISITDLTYNDFRADLNKLTDEEFKAIEIMPKGLLGVVKATTNQPAGVIFCLREDGPDHEDGPRSGIAPYHLIYLDEAGQVRVPPNNPKKALDDYRSLALKFEDIDLVLEQLLAKKTDRYKKPTLYQRLLATTLKELGDHKGKESVVSIFNEAGSNLGQPFQDTRFKLVNYLVILPAA